MLNLISTAGLDNASKVVDVAKGTSYSSSLK